MAIDYRLCNVLLADGTRFDEHPELYVRQSVTAGKAGDHSVVLSPRCMRYDFATYLNAFSYVKWREYTTIGNVWLHLRARGSFEILYTGYETLLQKPKRVVFAQQSYELDEYTDIDFCFPKTDAVLLSFEIVTSEPLNIADAYYYTKVEEQSLRPIELAVCTTTFCKEEYVVPNMMLFKEHILECDEPIAKHFTLHVVDNGRTLDVEEYESERIHVHPNPNVGGAGGFARGMIEAMEQEPQATHVLLMDDDVQIHPEAIKRTYNLLRLLKDECLGYYVSGAMLCLEDPTMFHEDVGYVDPHGNYGAIKRAEDYAEFIDITELSNVMRLETSHSHVPNKYAAWWYCCIPMNTIKEKGLSLPIFIRGDDAEYGNRGAKGFISMNGICIWHQSSSGVFRAALERYYPLRNTLIAQAASGIYGNVDMLDAVHHFFGLDLKTFNYDSAEICLRALEDYLKGPDYLKHLKTDANNKALSLKNEQLKPIEEIDDELMRDVSFIPTLLPKNIEARGIAMRAFDYVTFNGQRVPPQMSHGGVAVIAYHGWHYPANTIRGKDAILAVTLDGKMGVLRKKNLVRLNELMKRYKIDAKEYEQRKDELAAQWAAARDELTSVKFWKWYLEDQAR